MGRVSRLYSIFLGVFTASMGSLNAQDGFQVPRGGGNPPVVLVSTATVHVSKPWLVKVQNSDGSWGSKNDTIPRKQAVTGLAVALAYDHEIKRASVKWTPGGERGLTWLTTLALRPDLKKRVRLKNGALAHAMATAGLCKAFPISKNSSLGMAIDVSIDLILEKQRPDGSFGNSYAENEWDLEATAWNLLALKNALAHGGVSGKGKEAKIRAALVKGRDFLMKQAYAGDGMYKTSSTSDKPSPKSAMAIWFLASIGQSKSQQVVDYVDKQIIKKRLPSFETVMADPTKWEAWSKTNSLLTTSYEHRLMTTVGKSTRPKAWKNWKRAVETVLVRAQNEEGFWTSSDTVVDTPAKESDKIYATILANLHLTRQPFATIELNSP